MSEILLQENIETINLKLCKKISDIILLENFSVGSYRIMANSAIKPNTGETITLKEKFNILQAEITAVKAIDEDIYEITVDSPSDKAFTASCKAEIGEKNLKGDGSIELQKASLRMDGMDENAIIEISAILFKLEDQNESLPESFGGRNKLKNGTVLRIVGENTKNILNVKNNKDFVMNFYKVSRPPKHLSKKYIVFAKKKYDEMILSTKDKLEVIVQDDLEKMDDFQITVKIKVININNK